MWLDKPLVQIPALPHIFSPGACITSLLKSSKGLWTVEDHSISWGAFRCPLGSLCLPGHPHTWGAKFSSVCFPQCHHFKVIPLLCMYCLLQTVVTPATKPLVLSAVRRHLGVLVPLSPWTQQQDSVWKIITGSAGRQRGPWTGLYNISRISTIKTSFLDHCKIMWCCLRRRYARRFHSEHFLSQVLGPRLLMWTELWIIWVPDEEVKYLYLL